MQKDFEISKKYTDDQFNSLDIPYKYRDYCQDDYADYLSCVRVHPTLLANNFVYKLPLSQYFTYCKPLLNQWEKCQKHREIQTFDRIKQIFQSQREKL